ncbi:MAG TPA: stage II sporulation protein M [Candidatus Methanofastidiosa archaeon]|nr:stage II sporulation protein M [Candidatus Methanofastidiosa archaeon]
MNPLMYLVLEAVLLVSYKVGDSLWKRFTDRDIYYYRVAYCAVTTAFLTFVLIFLTLFSDPGERFDNMVLVNVMQAIVSLGLFMVLHRRVRWSEVKACLRSDRKYIAYAGLFFVGGMLFGATAHEDIQDMLADQLDDLSEVSDLSEDRPLWQIGIFIFGNNTKTSILMGIMLPLIPLFGGMYIIFAMLLNGAIVGVLGPLLDKPITYLIVGIAPHGIFEIPAIIIAAAVGLKFNSRIMFGLLAVMRNRDQDSNQILKEYVSDAIGSWKLMYLVLFLLIIAAVVETTVTPYLLSMFK